MEGVSFFCIVSSVPLPKVCKYVISVLFAGSNRNYLYRDILDIIYFVLLDLLVLSLIFGNLLKNFGLEDREHMAICWKCTYILLAVKSRLLMTLLNLENTLI